MRPIDADAFIERFSHTPMVQEALRIAMDKMPTIEPERKKGKWVDLWDRSRCSACNMDSTYEHNFCPNCGADMGGEKDG